MRALDTSEQVRRVRADTEFLPGLRAIAAPGHTPGHLLFYLSANDIPVLFTGDAAKNRAELLSGHVDASECHADSECSLQTIWRWWREVPGTILIPGHDLTMRLDEDGQPELIGKRAAAIAAWFSESLSQATNFDLTDAAPQA
ncbi:MBL fold metallo-hydrolase [Cupriavidus sp. 8B]